MWPVVVYYSMPDFLPLASALIPFSSVFVILTFTELQSKLLLNMSKGVRIWLYNSSISEGAIPIELRIQQFIQGLSGD